MKVNRKVSPTTILEAEGQTVAEVFEALARMEEVFHGHEECGLCHKRETAYQVRQDKEGNKYYQVVCLFCKAEFRFGLKKQPQGVLFPQLKDKNGNWKPDGGWAKWMSNQEERS